MSLQIIKDHILNRLHQDAEYISAAVTYTLSFVSLNIHFSNMEEQIFIRFIIGFISLGFTALAVILTHYLKKYLERKK